MVSPYPADGEGARLPSGVAAYTARLAAALADAGAEVHVVAPRHDGEPAHRRDGAVTVTRAFRPGPAALPVALRAARRTGAPVVHLQHELFLYGGPSSVPGLVPALAGLRLADVRPVVTMHQVVDPAEIDAEFTRLHRVRVPAPLARLGLAATQRSVSGLSATTVVHEHAFTPLVSSARMVPHGIDRLAPQDRRQARARLGLSQDRLVVLCFGFLSPYKGLEAALEAAGLAGPAVELVLAGDEHPRLAGRDPYAADLQRRYGHVARFTGYVPDDQVASWFSAADVVLLPYPRPFASSGPLALALGFGRPVLCSPAFARCIGAGEELATPIDPAALAARLLELHAEPILLRRLAAASERMAEARTWDRVARAHLELYEEVTDAERAVGGRLRAGQPG